MEKEQSVRCLGGFLMDVGRMDEQAFSDRHGMAFLLYHGILGDLTKSAGTGDTLACEAKPGESKSFSPRNDFLVFPLQKRTAGDDLIWLGRSSGNDVVIPDASVSAVHAFIDVKQQGKFTTFHIQDSNSSNGTRVNDQEVAVQGQGPQVPIDSMSRIHLGSVELLFLRAPEFYSLVSRIG